MVDEVQSKGPGFFRALASTFVEFEGTKPGTVVQASPVAQPTASPVNSNVITGVAIMAASAIDQGMLDSLQKIITGRKTAFTALTDAADRMSNIIKDEPTRIQAAWAGLSEGRSVSDILSSIDLHISDIDAEGKRFTTTVAAQIAQKSGVLTQNANQFDIDAEASRTRAAQLRAEADAHDLHAQQKTVSANELRTQAAIAESEVRGVETRFNATLTFLRDKLVARKTQIQTTII